MGKKQKRRTAAQNLKELVKSPDLKNLSTQLRSIPVRTAEAIDRQLGEHRADEQRISEANEQAFTSFRAPILLLSEALSKSKDEDSRSSLRQQIDTLIHEWMGEAGKKAVADILKDVESTLPTADDIVRDVTAHMAIHTCFLGSRYEEAISAAFTAFNLDKGNPLNWRVILGLLAWTHFNDPRKKGRPPEWTSERYCLLLEHVDRINAGHSGRLGDSRACELLTKKKEFSTAWTGQSSKRLEGALAEARDPYRNRALLKPVLDECMVIADRALASGEEMSSEEEAALIKKLARKHADAIGRRWRKDTDH
jgi:hypothetical protein